MYLGGTYRAPCRYTWAELTELLVDILGLNLECVLNVFVQDTDVGFPCRVQDELCEAN